MDAALHEQARAAKGAPALPPPCSRPPPVVLSDDLVREPEGMLRALCASLDVPFEPQVGAPRSVLVSPPCCRYTLSEGYPGGNKLACLPSACTRPARPWAQGRFELLPAMM